MPPKKVAAVTKVTVSTTVDGSVVPSQNQRKPHQGVSRRISTVLILYKRPPVLKMVLNALRESKDRKGTTVPAIRNYILSAYPTVNPVYLKHSLKRALSIGLEKGFLIRPANSKATGATGRFKLAARSDVKKNATKKDNENVDPNHVKPKVKNTEPETRSGTSKAKLGLSKVKGKESGKVKKPKSPSGTKTTGNTDKKSKAVKTDPDSLSNKKASKLLPPIVMKQSPGQQGKEKAKLQEAVPSSSKTGSSVKEVPGRPAKKPVRPKKKVQKDD
ncbi:protein B4-like [Scyliorhinus canicula]|uniref:protein B4-like n=1 Tax=Scyliorhinus canicula TaxID=7830 RepID=UPI0018F486AB|nr:protein B4-like [Scyliorhinus canicula]